MENENPQAPAPGEQTTGDMPLAPLKRRRRKWWRIPVAIVLCLFAAALWYWHDANVMPVVSIPPAPPLPSPNAEDTFVAAADAITYGSGDVKMAAMGSTSPTLHDPPLADCAALVASNAAVLQKVKDGLKLEYGHDERQLVNGVTPRYAKMRALSRYLLFVAKTRERQGDWSGAMDSVLDGLDMGSHLTGHVPFITFLINVAIQTNAQYSSWDIIGHLKGTEARAVARRLESIEHERPVNMAVSLIEEKREDQELLMSAFRKPRTEMVQAIYAIDNAGEAGASPEGSEWLRLYYTNKCHTMDDVTRYMDACIKKAASPGGWRPPYVNIPKWDDAALHFTAAYERGMFKADHLLCEKHLLLLTLALRAYQCDHGAAPATLKALVPDYLDAIPTDPFAPDGAFRYRVTSNGYLLYSVGPDGVDDGGKAITDLGGANMDSKGDIVAGVNRW